VSTGADPPGIRHEPENRDPAPDGAAMPASCRDAGHLP
jgi:hypothetical protein